MAEDSPANDEEGHQRQNSETEENFSSDPNDEAVDISDDEEDDTNSSEFDIF